MGKNSFEIITNVRNIRSSKQISPKELMPLQINGHPEEFSPLSDSIRKLAHISEIGFSPEKPEHCFNFVVKSTEFYLISDDAVDIEAERAAMEKDLAYQEGFLKSVDKKLSNEKFVNGAPEKVVEMERKKKADAEAKIKALKEGLAKLG